MFIHNRRFAITATVIALLGLLLSPQTNATMLTVEPDDFANGADIRTAVPGITLSIEGHPGAVVRSRTGVLAGGPTAGLNISSTGSRVFGHDINGPTVPTEDFRLLWTTIAPAPVFRADFDALADFVSIDAIANEDDSFALQAFDSGGLLLDTFLTGVFVNGVRTMSISRSSFDIAYILAFGLAPEGGGLLDNFKVNVVPVPGAVWLLFSGIAVLFGFGWRRHRSCS